MHTAQVIHCPNCGAPAERKIWRDQEQKSPQPTDQLIVETTCRTCDYLMIMGLSSGRVIEAYAPGVSMPLGQSA